MQNNWGNFSNVAFFCPMRDFSQVKVGKPKHRVAWPGPYILYGLPINRQRLSAMTLCLIHIAHTNKLANNLTHWRKANHLQFLVQDQDQNRFFFGLRPVFSWIKSTMYVKSILWTMSCSVFKRVKLYTFSPVPWKSARQFWMKESDILGVKTYAYLLHIFSGVRTPNAPWSTPLLVRQ